MFITHISKLCFVLILIGELNARPILQNLLGLAGVIPGLATGLLGGLLGAPPQQNSFQLPGISPIGAQAPQLFPQNGFSTQLGQQFGLGNQSAGLPIVYSVQLPPQVGLAAAPPPAAAAPAPTAAGVPQAGVANGLPPGSQVVLALSPAEQGLLGQIGNAFNSIVVGAGGLAGGVFNALNYVGNTFSQQIFGGSGPQAKL